MGLLPGRAPNLEKLARRGDVAGLLSALQHEDPAVRAPVPGLLSRFEEPGVSQALVHALADPDDGVRACVRAALIARGPQRALGPLVDAVVGWTGPDREIGREEALAALEAMRDAGVSARVAAALADRDAGLDDSDADVVRRLANASENGMERTVGRLIEMMGHDERGARADRILVWLAPGGARWLVEALRDPDKREHAAMALGRAHETSAVEALCSLMVGGDHPSIRRVAAWALGEIRDPKSVEALMLATGDPDFDVRTEAGRAFDRFGNVGVTIALSVMMPQALPPGPEQEAEPAPESAAEPAPESAVEPAPESAAEPAPEHAVEPPPEAAAEPPPESTVGPAPESAVEPAPESTVGPAPESAVEPAPEHAVEPPPEQEPEPVVEAAEPLVDEAPQPRPKPAPAPPRTPRPSSQSSAVVPTIRRLLGRRAGR